MPWSQFWSRFGHNNHMPKSGIILRIEFKRKKPSKTTNKEVSWGSPKTYQEKRKFKETIKKLQDEHALRLQELEVRLGVSRV